MIVVVQNDPLVPLGSFEWYLNSRGTAYRTIRVYDGEMLHDPAGNDAVIVLGGAMGVHDEAKHPFLHSVKRFIADSVRNSIPFLGVCLGGQLLADTLGGVVSSGSCGERGTFPIALTESGVTDPLFSGMDNPFISFQWHHDSFGLPSSGVCLASSPVCPNQAFRCGNAYGLQFHPEVTEEILLLWCREISGDPGIPVSEADELLTDFKRFHKEYSASSRRLFMNFLTLAGIK